MKTLSQLVQRIASANITDVVEAEPWLSTYQGEDWQDYLGEIPPGANNRILLQNHHARLMLIRWDGHSSSTLHGHPDRGCLLKVLSGMLLETRYDSFMPGRITGKHQLYPGDLTFIHDAFAYHIVENPTLQPAVSLHLYAPGIYSARIIHPEPVHTGTMPR